jgi:hypothetical protein
LMSCTDCRASRTKCLSQRCANVRYGA